MFAPAHPAQVYISTGITDIHKSINGLSILVSDQLELDPSFGHLFAFCNRKCDIINILSCYIKYIPMRGEFMYLFAIMDWYSRKILAGNFPNSLDTEFCLKSMKRALLASGIPEIINTDQGCLFTSDEWVKCLNSQHHNQYG